MLHVKAIKSAQIYANKFSISIQFECWYFFFNKLITYDYLPFTQSVMYTMPNAMPVIVKHHKHVTKFKNRKIPIIFTSSRDCDRYATCGKMVTMTRMWNNSNMIANVRNDVKLIAMNRNDLHFDWSSLSLSRARVVRMCENLHNFCVTENVPWETHTFRTQSAANGNLRRSVIETPASIMLFMNWADHKSSQKLPFIRNFSSEN